MSIDYSDMAFPKPVKRKKKRVKKKPILKTSKKICFLCAHLKGDLSHKTTEEHHVLFGSGKKKHSDDEGLIANLCLKHHRIGDNAVHNNKYMRRLLCELFQEKFEETDTREEWMRISGKNYLGTSTVECETVRRERNHKKEEFLSQLRLARGERRSNVH